MGRWAGMINPTEDRGQTLHALVVAARLSLSQTLGDYLISRAAACPLPV